MKIHEFFETAESEWIQYAGDGFLHWTGVQVSPLFIMTIPDDSPWLPYATKALSEYIAQLSPEERTIRKQRFDDLRSAWAFFKDFQTWLLEKSKSSDFHDFILPTFDRMSPMWDLFSHLGPKFPTEMKIRLLESRKAEKEFQEWYWSLCVGVVFIVNEDGSPKECFVKEERCPLGV